ncbi:hypothetical protein [Catalinimonas niigatensis]|uniref:hypothetical protein n=1 Tax=Catalinimonas niigatensis TaxID=1397264 RepID=UPI0026656078|nr:hypothetical protein [Catalinimonas niigatensis]WPP48188.1 hypothetical protein PZB72_16075 [Catalinimonas niigatensis]
MKTKAVFFVALFCVLNFVSFSVSASDEPAADDQQMTKKEFQIALDALKERAENLKEAKKHALTQAEKKAFREEIKDVKKETRELKQQASGGIYIGGGALLVIVLLLILL